MGSEITRKVQRIAVSTATSEGAATAVRFEDFAGGLVGATATVGGTQTVTFYAAATETGSYYQVCDQYGTAVSATLPVGDPKYVHLPTELFAAPWVKMVSASATAVVLLVKS